MKKSLLTALIGLSFTCVASLAAMPPYPAPVPGESCMGTYPPLFGNTYTNNPGDNTVNFCGCYAGMAEATCTSGHEPTQCNQCSASLAISACSDVTRVGGVQMFCQIYSSTDVANCVQDLGAICNTSAGQLCNSLWSNATCYTVGNCSA